MKTSSGVRSAVMYRYGNDARFFTSSLLRHISPSWEQLLLSFGPRARCSASAVVLSLDEAAITSTFLLEEASFMHRKFLSCTT